MVEKTLKKSKSRILNAILKYGYSKFTIEILEYCDLADLIKREQYYINLLDPEYNISKTPGASMTGRSHSEETRSKISSSKKGSKHSEETRAKMSSVKAGEKHYMFGLKHSDETRAKMSSFRKEIEVTDLTLNITTRYDSISAAALALNIRKSTISNYFARNQKFFKNQYIFKKV